MSKALRTVAKIGTFGVLGFAISAFLKKPKAPVVNAQNEKKSRPVRKHGFGITRVSGAWAKRQDADAVFVQIFAYPEGPGPVDHYGRAWLNEDEVKPLGSWFEELDDGRYETGRAKYEERPGTRVQAAYSTIIGSPWGWSAEHYGSGVPSNLLICEHGKKEDAQKQFPSGQQTELTREVFYKAYDWRRDSTAGGDGPQRRYAPDATPEEIDEATATWEVTTNPVVGLVNVEWLQYGADWDTCFAPILDLLTAEADVCDEMILQRNGASQVAGTANPGNAVTLLGVAGLAIGSDINIAGQTFEVTNLVGNVVTVDPPFTEKLPIFAPARWVNASPVYAKRYEIGLQWEADDQRKDVREWFLATMDGHFSIRSDGAYAVRSGHFYEPTIIFGSPEIIDWEYDPGPQIGEEPNILTLSFSDPITGYKDTDTDELRNESAILTDGKENVDDFSPKGVPTDSALKRLAKATMDRNHAPRLTIRTPLSARRGFGERFIGVRIRGNSSLHDVVLEVLEAPRISLRGQPSIIWSGRLAGPSRYAWNAATEEGNGPVAGYVGANSGLATPDITSIDVTFQDPGPAPQLTINGTGPDRGDLSWFFRVRTSGDTSWAELPAADSDPSPDFSLTTPSVQAVPVLEVQVACATAGGTQSLWGPVTPFEVDTTAANVAPAPPPNGAATSPGAGQIHVTGRNSTSSLFDHVRIWRGSSTDSFGMATSQGTVTGAPGANFVFDQTGVTAGSYRIWITAENPSNVASSPIGPFAVTVT